MTARPGIGATETSGGNVERRRAAVGAVASVALLVPTLAACQGDGEPTPQPAPPSTAAAADLTLGTYGMPAAEVEALVAETAELNEATETRQVQVQASDSSLRDAVAAGEALPDLFFASNSDLAYLDGQDLIEPVDSYMVDRNVDFGDTLSYDGVKAFTVNDRLACMPYSIDPLVIFYNKALVDWDAMEAEGLPVPSSGRWGLEELEAAARFASDPEAGTKGLYVGPTLEQLAPFVLSGGGAVFDDQTPPTSTALSEESSVSALTQALQVLREPQITLTADELAQADAMEWFTSGRLGMIMAPRSEVPALRAVDGLDFDVIFPPSVDERATVGTAGGICMSLDSEAKEAAADTIVDLTSPDAMAGVTEAGYIVPVLLEVAQSDAYQQPDQLPESASVWTNNLRYTYFLPAVPDEAALDAAVAPYLDALLNDAILNEETILSTVTELDEASRLLLGGSAAEE